MARYLVTYDPAADRIRLIDNKSVTAGAEVKQVSALEKNLLTNLRKDTQTVAAYVGQPDVPSVIGTTVLPRMRQAVTEMEQWVAAHPTAKLTSKATQQEFGEYVERHGIERVVSLSGAGEGADVSKRLLDDLGFSR